MSTDEQLTALATAIESKRPFCSGVCSLPVSAFGLFFKRDKIAGWANLSEASESEIKQLSDACQPASFGQGQQNVHDESYRKAGKLDVSDFATGLSVEHSGIVDVIRSELLEGRDGGAELEADLYKLNVYEKGSFFKAHKDTPHGKDMFGSLVVAFPTAHDGGALVLRHKGKEWTWDSSEALAHRTNPLSVAYIAFYSDVEHEVVEVTSGNRVTLTYNLYFKFGRGRMQALDSNAGINLNPTPPSNKTAFKSELSRLLLDQNFLPHGGRLGFGLQHQYPVDSKTGSLDGLLNCLKGSDAVIRQVCQELSLKASLKVMYSDDGHLVMVRKIVDMSGYLDVRESISDLLQDDFGGRLVSSQGLSADDMDPDGTEEIWWVTPMTAMTRATTPYVAYGNEATLAYMYGDICLIVDVGKAGNREKRKGDKPRRKRGRIE